MFTGIIETLGIISDIKKDQGNVHLTIQTNVQHSLVFYIRISFFSTKVKKFFLITK